ncbi:uncharacterized protein LOC119068550 [Bradysia coprophila]|uniref:uncharacterized protein LOC119068550 n=1 Tax=Bradysia coprophila TaxID=38358 RepID=UPI00187DB3F5|nr:uncharacterized protein LOC119068550 [Bradysia coprophila]
MLSRIERTNMGISSGTSPITQLNQNSICNPHSTTSPKTSPNISLTNSSQMTPTLTDENDNNNNVDEGFENDNISVTGSPPLANSTEDEDKRSPTPPTGAFTSLIQKNASSFKKSDFLSGFASHIHQPNQHVFNHALAAQLFLQSPLMPQPSQWLYTQLYGNYNDMPWFRNTFQNGSNFRPTAINNEEKCDVDNGTLGSRSITLITHNDETENRLSPPVSSTRRSLSPTDEDEEVDVTCRKGDSIGPIRCRTPSKHVDVWRPY